MKERIYTSTNHFFPLSRHDTYTDKYLWKIFRVHEEKENLQKSRKRRLVVR